MFSLIFLAEDFADVSVLFLSGFWHHKISHTINAINAFCQRLRKDSIAAFVLHKYLCKHPYYKRLFSGVEILCTIICFGLKILKKFFLVHQYKPILYIPVSKYAELTPDSYHNITDQVKKLGVDLFSFLR